MAEAFLLFMYVILRKHASPFLKKEQMEEWQHHLLVDIGNGDQCVSERRDK